MSRWLRVAFNVNNLIGKVVEMIDSTNKNMLSSCQGEPALFDFLETENIVILHFLKSRVETSTIQNIKKARNGVIEVKTANSVYKFQILSNQDLFNKQAEMMAEIINNMAAKHPGKHTEQDIQKRADLAADKIINGFFRKYKYSDELISKLNDVARELVSQRGQLMEWIPYSAICDAIDRLI